MRTNTATSQTVSLPAFDRAATLGTVDREARTVEIVWTTGATVRRARMFDEPFDETLEVSPEALRLERLQSGRMSVMEEHGRAERYTGSQLRAVLGVVEDGWLEGGEGHARIRFGRSERAEEVWRDVQDGIVGNVSASYRVHRFRDVTLPDSTVRQLLAIDWEPYELSFVAIPADASTGVRSEEPGEGRAFDCLIESQDPMKTKTTSTNGAVAGAPATPSTDPATRTATPPTEPEPEPEGTATRAAPLEPAPPAVTAPPVTLTRSAVDEHAETIATRAARVAVAEERQRSSDIRGAVERSGAPAELAEELIANGSTMDAARSAILDSLYERAETGPPIGSPMRVTETQRDGMAGAIASALLNRHDPVAFELSEQGRQYRGLRLVEVCREVLSASGDSCRGLMPSEIAERAMHSTSDLPNIVANVANQALRRAYDESPRNFDPITRPRTAADFKPLHSTQLSAAPTLEAIGEHGEIQFGALSDSDEVYSVTSWARRSAVTRQAIINDSMDAFARIPQLFGLAAARTLANQVWAILTANPTMGDGNALFSGAHGNDGTTILTDQTDLQELVALLRMQTGLAGEVLNLGPALLIVPPALETVAASVTTNVTPANSGDVNPWAGKLTPIIEQRLNANPTYWYMAAALATIDLLEIAYLEGRTAPLVSTRQGWEVQGIEIKAEFDFGVKAIDWRGLTRSVGSTA